MKKPDVIVCDKCRAEMEPIYPKLYDRKLHGWLCWRCDKFIKAIGRERFFIDGEKTPDSG